MKKLFTFIFLVFIIITFSQTNPTIRTMVVTSPVSTIKTALVISNPIPQEIKEIGFEYDDAGNQVVRKPIYLALPRLGRPTTPNPEVPKEFVESDIYSDVLYYPNPTIEILYVKWKNENETFVDSMQLYNLNGQQMLQLNDLKNQETNEINFQTFPSGMYELVLVYSNSKKKTLKIIKQ